MHKFILLTLLIIISSCVPLQYAYYNPNIAHTGQYSTFVVINNCEESQTIISDEEQDEVINTFNEKLKIKGVRPEGNQIADLIVSFYVKANYYEVEDICFDNYEDYILGPICKAKVITYEVNTLVIDFFDTEKNTVVFHSAVEGLSFTKPDKFNGQIDKAITHILEQFDANATTGV